MKLFFLNLKQAARNLRRQVWQAGVSAVGLAFGIVCLTFSLNWLWTETNYDYFRPQYKDLYIMQVCDSTGQGTSMPSGVADQADSLLQGLASVGMYKGGVFQEARLMHPETGEVQARSSSMEISPEMADLLGLKAVSGSLEDVLKKPEQVAVSQKIARQLFGEEEAVGKNIKLQKWIIVPELYTIGAVVEDMDGLSNIGTDVFVGLGLKEQERSWALSNFNVLIRTKDPVGAEKRLEQIRLPDGMPRWTYRLAPLCTIHKLGSGSPFWKAYFYPLAFFCIALLLCVGAAFNLIAVYTSIFLSRLREYELRMSLGSTWRKNAGWLLVEVGLLLAVALLLAGACTEWAAYLYPDLPGDSGHRFVAFGQSAGIVCGLSLLLMAYPLLRMHRAYRNALRGQAAGHPHTWLLFVQTFVCALLLFVGLGMYRMLYGMMHGDLGFDRTDILRLQTGGYFGKDSDLASHMQDFFQILPGEFRKESGAGIVDALPMRSDIFNRSTRHAFSVENREGRVGEDFLWFVELPYRASDFFGIKLSAGRFPQHVSDGSQEEAGDVPVSTGAMPVILNETAMRKFRIPHIGAEGYRSGEKKKQYDVIITASRLASHIYGRPMEICGVMNMRLTDYRQEEEPLCCIIVPEDHKSMYLENDAIYVKHEPGRRADAEAAMRRVMKKLGVREDLIRIQSMDEYISSNYEAEAFYARLLGVLAACSVLITLSGVFSMLLYSLRLRRRSMAIRRVMGAGFRELLQKTLRPYLFLTLLSCFLAYPPAAYLMKKWMEYFTYGEGVSPWLMVGIALGMLVMVALIVWTQLRRVMREKPVDILRPEA